MACEDACVVDSLRTGQSFDGEGKSSYDDVKRLKTRTWPQGTLCDSVVLGLWGVVRGCRRRVYGWAMAQVRELH